MPTLIKENYKNIIITSLIIFTLPIINLIIHMIYTYGTYVGTFIRNIDKFGACF